MKAISLLRHAAALLLVLFGLPHAQALEPEVRGGLRMSSLFAPFCQAIAYQPVPAFQAPGGMRVGQLVLDHPEYVAKTLPKCSLRPRVALRPEGFNRLMPVAVVEVSREEPALAVMETRRTASGVWYRAEAEGTTFWVRGDEPGTTTRYLSYELHMVSGVGLFSEGCDELGRCKPLPQDLQATADQAGAERTDSCFATAYEFTQDEGASVVTLPGGRKAYRLRLAEEMTPKYGKRLPQELLIPTYDYRGRWTGFFLPRGC